MSYLVRVQKFFIKHDPDHLYLAKRIARSFRQDEEAVMKRLEEIYAKGGPKKLKVKEISKVVKKENPTPYEVTEEIVNDDVNSTVKDVKPKKVDEAMSDAYGMVNAEPEQTEGSVEFKQHKNTDKGSVSIEASADDMQELAKVLKLAG